MSMSFPARPLRFPESLSESIHPDCFKIFKGPKSRFTQVNYNDLTATEPWNHG